MKLNPFRLIIDVFQIYSKNLGSKLYLVCLLSFLAALADGLGITMLIPILGYFEAGELPAGEIEIMFFKLLESMGMEKSLLSIMFFICILFITKGIFVFIHLTYTGYLVANLSKDLKEKMFESYNHTSYSYFLKNNTGYYVNIFNDQINNFSLSFNRFSGFVSNSMMTFGYLSFAFLISWEYALMALSAGIVLMYLFKFLNEYMRLLSRKSVKEMEKLNKFLLQSLQSFKYIISTNQSHRLKNFVYNSTRKHRDYSFRSWSAVALTQGIREPISVLLIALILFMQVYIMEGTINTVIVVIILFYRTIGSVITIQTNWQGVMSMIGSIEVVDKELEMLNKNKEYKGTIQFKEFKQSIEFQNVSFSYVEGQKPVIKNMNLCIPANTTIAIVGESGAGKSTLVDLLTLIHRPSSGNIFIDGIDSKKICLSSWRSKIGYVSQETIIFDDSFANNISMWQQNEFNNKDLIQRIRESAKIAYINKYIEETPMQYDTIVGDRGVLISGGQKQRLFIAREIFKNPEMLVLDEATSSLDTESEKFIQNSIDALKGSITMVIIAHRLSTITNSDYIYVLSNGTIIEEGTYDDLSRKPNSKLSKMLDFQKV